MENQDTPPQPPRPAQPDPCPPRTTKFQAFTEDAKRLGQALQEYKWIVYLVLGLKAYHDLGPTALSTLAPAIKAAMDLLIDK